MQTNVHGTQLLKTGGILNDRKDRRVLSNRKKPRLALCFAAILLFSLLLPTRAYPQNQIAFVDGNSTSIGTSGPTQLALLNTTFPAGSTNFVIAIVQLENQNAVTPDVAIAAGNLHLEKSGSYLMTNSYTITIAVGSAQQQKWYALMGIDSGGIANAWYSVTATADATGAVGEAKIIAISGVTGAEAQSGATSIGSSDTNLTQLTVSPAGDNIIFGIFETWNTANGTDTLPYVGLKTTATLAQNEYPMVHANKNTPASDWQVQLIPYLDTGAGANTTYYAAARSSGGGSKMYGVAKIVAFSRGSLSAAYSDGAAMSFSTSEATVNTLNTTFTGGREVAVIASEQFSSVGATFHTIAAAANKLQQNGDAGSQTSNQYQVPVRENTLGDSGQGWGLLNRYSDIPASPTYTVKAAANSSSVNGESKILALATPAPLYRSVGRGRLGNGEDLNLNSRTVQIAGTTATFSGPMPDNVGIGDVLQYGISPNFYLAFIHGRTSSMVYTVKDKDGGTPTAAPAGTTAGVFRAYISLNNWNHNTSAYVNSNIDSSVRANVVPSKNLVSANTVMMVPCYGDGYTDYGFLNSDPISGWTTGAANYIKIYTPVSSSEVGISQRHNGTWDTGKYKIHDSTSLLSAGIYVTSATNIWIDGLQIYLTAVDTDGDCGIRIVGGSNVLDHRISNCIIRGPTSASTLNHFGIYFSGAAGSIARIWNNIVYDFTGASGGNGGYGIGHISASTAMYAYNNTVYGNNWGFYQNGGTVVAKNNISYANSDNYIGSFSATGCNNLSGPGTDAEMPIAGKRDGVPVAFDAPTATPRDLHLASSDTGAKDYGFNLSSDSILAFSTDIDGHSRPQGSSWDIGADEYGGAPFDYRREITINYSQRGSSCTSPLTNFPVLISLSGTWLRTRANDPTNGRIENANGHDIVFRASDGKTQLDHEIELYDGGASAGTLIAWVRIPSLFAGDTNTTIYIYYGNAWITAPTANPTGVWDTSYKGVWHLKEATGAQVNDSTTTPNNGTPQASPTQTIGKIDGSLSFNSASSQYVQVGNSTDLQLSTNMTVSGWMNTTSSDYQSRLIAAKWGDAGNRNYWLGKFWPGATTLQLSFAVSNGASNVVIPWSINNGAWHYVVGVADVVNSLLRLYVDGAQQASVGYGGTSETGTSELDIGKSPNDTLQLWDGLLDEVRVSNTARDACWIGTEYNSQNTPWSFISLGNEGVASPTVVNLTSFTATQYSEGVLLRWKTGHEVNNLGFHVYREENGQLTRLTPEPVAGSALIAGSRTALTAGHQYHWWDMSDISDQLSVISDDSSSLGTRHSTLATLKYWLKDIDLNGRYTMHGPVTPTLSREPIPYKFRPELLSEIGWRLEEKYRDYWKARELKERLRQKPKAKVEVKGASRGRGLRSTSFEVKASNLKGRRPGPEGNPVPDPQTQWYLASRPAVKILVKDEGWYRVTQPELIAAGLSSKVNPRYLQLFVEGQEQPIRVIGDKDGRFDPGDAIEFYGVNLDTPSTDARVYWLIEGTKPGKRVHEYKGYSGSLGSLSFPYAVERKERTLYFAALLNGEEENFFGPVVYMNEVDQILELQHLDPNTTENALLEVVLQGATDTPHRVKVLLNETEVGEIAFEGQGQGILKVEVSQSMLEEGENLVSLVAMGDDMDATLLDTIQLTYWHTYTADNDSLRFTAQGGSHLTLSGFSHPKIRVIDITDSNEVIEVIGKVDFQKGGYGVSFRVPGTGERTLLALTDERAKSPLEVISNHASTWHQESSGYDLVIISHRDFMDSLEPLRQLRESQGLRVALIDVEDLYDEFSFGNKSSKAIRDFLSYAKTKWQKPPRFVLLVGDASFDPRNYLGLGDMDYVPTKLIDTVYMETASDDWFVDLNGDGVPEMAIGRLPVQTKEEAAVVVSKIVGYEKSDRKNEALLVADRADNSDDFNFAGASEEIRALLPAYLMVRKIFRGQFSSDTQAKVELLNGINQGALLVNFIGHGSIESWRGSLLTLEDAESLINGLRLPFFVNMTCLNGYFQNPYGETLAEGLIKAPGGGAIAIWSSSGLTEPDKQALMNKELIRLLFSEQSLTLGEATARAKSAVGDQDVRRTWILFGDPSIKLKW